MELRWHPVTTTTTTCPLSFQVETLTVLLPLLLTVHHTSMDSYSPARLGIGQLLPVLGVDTAMLQVVFKAILKSFRCPTASPPVTSPIGQFTVQDLRESG